MKINSFRLLVSAGLLLLTVTLANAATSSAELAALREKAENGNPIAQYNLGLVYADVREPAHSYPEAYSWLSIAADNGATGRALASVVELMTPAERAAGDNLLASRRAAIAASPAPSANAPAAAPIITAAPLDTRAENTAITPEAAFGAAQPQVNQQLTAALAENQRLRANAASSAELKKRVAIAESALETKDRELTTLRQRVATLEAARTADSEVAELRQKVAAAEDQSIELRRTLATVETERDALAAQADRAQTAQTQVEELNQRLTAANTAADAARQSSRELRNELDAREQALVEARAALETQLAAATQESDQLAALRTELKASQAAQAELKAQLATAATNESKQLNALRDELKTNQAAQSDLTAKLAAATAQAAQQSKNAGDTEALRHQLTKLKQDLASTQIQLADQSAERERLAATVASAREKTAQTPRPDTDAIADLRLELAETKAELETALSAQTKTARQLAEAHEANVSLQAAAEAHQTTANNALQSELTSLNGQLDESRRALAEAEAKTATLNTQLEAALATPATEAGDTGDPAALAAIQTRLDASLRAFGVQERELKRLKAELADRESAAGDTAAELTALREQLTAAQTELAASVPDIAAAENALAHEQTATATARAEADALRAQLAAANHTLADRSDTLSSQETELAHVQSAVASSQAIIDRLQEELRLSRLQSTSLAQQVDELRTRLVLIPPSPATNRAAPLRPGQVPAISPSASNDPPVISASLPPSATTFLPAARPPAIPAATTGPRTHTVMPGESLSVIAQNYYGDASRWAEIFEANRSSIPAPNRLGVGTLLRIP